MFTSGTDAPYLSAERARPSIDQIPSATLYEVSGGDGPWLVDPNRGAELTHTHVNTGVGRRVAELDELSPQTLDVSWSWC